MRVTSGAITIDTMNCPGCQSPLTPGALFCSHCGASVGRSCSACQAKNPAGAKFCASCGKALGEAPQSALPAAPEDLRHVVILFADLAGYTRLSAGLAPDELHEVMGTFFAVVDAAVIEAGGTIDKHIGDCVMALFGAPIARGNEAERALSAALAIHAKLAARQGQPTLRAHIGIASGLVVAEASGSELHRAYTATGDAVNLASRLTDLAKAGETVIDDPCRQVLGRKLKAEDLGPQEIKGLPTPVRAWRAQGLSAEPLANEHAFVGRQAEIDILSLELTRALQSGRGTVISLRGEAGIGKSRLAAETALKAEQLGYAVHRSGTLDFGGPPSNEILPALTRDLLNLAEQDLASLRQSLPEDLARLLSAALGLPPSPEDYSFYQALDLATRQSRIATVQARLWIAAGRARPRLILFEDAHWADSDILQALQRIGSHLVEAPVVLLLTTRPEPDRLNAAWRVGLQTTRCMTLDLTPLSDSEARQLALTFLKGSDATVERVLERAGGHPLFLEQLLTHTLPGAGEAIPGSVQSLVQARLDRLSPEERRAIQAASVLGQQFELSAWQAVMEGAPTPSESLIAKRLLRPDPLGLAFAHALLRDAVYGSLAGKQRRRLHALAADWYLPRQIALAAEHLARANDSRAAKTFLAAAEAEADRPLSAIAMARKGLEAPGSDADHTALNLHLGELLLDRGDGAGARTCFEAALAASDQPATQVRAQIGLGAASRLADDYVAGLALLAEAEPLAKAHALHALLAKLYYLRGNLHFPRGESALCLAAHQAGLEAARNAGSRELEARALGGLADAYYVGGRLRSAGKAFRQCIELSESLGLLRAAAPNLPMLALARTYDGALEEAFALLQKGLDLSRRLGLKRAELIATHSAFVCAAERGEYQAGLELARQALLASQEIGSKLFESEGHLFVCCGLLRLGDIEPAKIAAEQAVESSRRAGFDFTGPTALAHRAWLHGGEAARRDLAECRERLATTAISHNHWQSLRPMIAAYARLGEWGDVRAVARSLKSYCGEEIPLLLEPAVQAAEILADDTARTSGAAKELIKELEADARQKGWVALADDLAELASL